MAGYAESSFLVYNRGRPTRPLALDQAASASFPIYPLEALLPEGFHVDGEPVVTVEVSYFAEIEWLAGRGYNVCGVKFPAVFQGQRDRASGPFLTVLWENLTDPILTGREELGFSKIYCEIPEPRVYAGTAHIATSWLGFKMMDLKVWDLAPAPLPPAAEPTPAGGAVMD